MERFLVARTERAVVTISTALALGIGDSWRMLAGRRGRLARPGASNELEALAYPPDMANQLIGRPAHPGGRGVIVTIGLLSR